MWTDEFTLYDEDNNEILSRSIAQHIQWAISAQGLLEGQNAERCYTVVSDVSGYEMKVDRNTTVEDWRTYADKCLMASD